MIFGTGVHLPAACPDLIGSRALITTTPKKFYKTIQTCNVLTAWPTFVPLLQNTCGLDPNLTLSASQVRMSKHLV
jgi:hypothetical protein